MKFSIFGYSVNFAKKKAYYGNQRSARYLSETPKIDANTLFSAYLANSDVYACIRELKNNTGKGGYNLINNEDEEEEVDETIKQYIKFILNSPFSTHSNFLNLKNRIVRDRRVAGNAFLHILKNANDVVVGLQPIDPRHMSIITDDHGQPIQYIQKIGLKECVRFEPEEIIHTKLSDSPRSEVFGISDIEPLIWEIRTDTYAMMNNYTFFENYGVPAVHYILDPELTDEEAQKAMEWIENNLKGAMNQNKSVSLRGVIDIKHQHIPNKDMEFMQGRQFTRERICATFGVPQFMLGYTAQVNNNNGVELRRNFLENTIKPEELDIEAEVFNELIKRLKLDSQITFQFKQQKLETEKEIEERALKELELGAITLREYRTKTFKTLKDDDEKLPNYDSYVLHRGSSAVLIEDVGVDPIINIEDDEKTNNFIKKLENIKNEL